MNNFALGIIVGMSIFFILVYVVPLKIGAVQQALIEENHGYYDSKTKKFILRECKE